MNLNPAGDHGEDPHIDSDESLNDGLDLLNLAELEGFLPEMRRRDRFDPPVINLPWMKAFKRDDLLRHLFVAVIRHPRDYMATLVRLGFEPLPARNSTSLISQQPLLRLPGFFSYIGYIIRTDGFFGIYRGLHYNLVHSISYDFVYKNVNSLAMQKISRFALDEECPEEAFQSVRMFTSNLSREIGARVIAHVVTYPLKVIAIRSMAQFVGGETFYNSWAGSITDICKTEGLLGFYWGIVPLCIAESFYVATRWMMYYFLHDKLDRSKRATILLATNMLADSATNPFRTVSIVMACNGPSCSLTAANYTGPAYSTWVHCLGALWSQGEASRGASLFWRTRPLPKPLDGGHFLDIEQRQ